jgi:FtsH-binding integral membrane protein
MVSPVAAVADFLAATSLRDLPSEFWMRLGIAIMGLIIAVVVIRKLAQVNKVVLGVIVFVAATFLGFNWIYERNEPSWATPVVQWLAEFFPTKRR